MALSGWLGFDVGLELQRYLPVPVCCSICDQERTRSTWYWVTHERSFSAHPVRYKRRFFSTKSPWEHTCMLCNAIAQDFPDTGVRGCLACPLEGYVLVDVKPSLWLAVDEDLRLHPCDWVDARNWEQFLLSLQLRRQSLPSSYLETHF